MKTPSERARATARTNRGAWVYELDPTVAHADGDVPPHLIVGAWRSDARGEIVGEFRPNPDYRPAGAIPDDASEILDQSAGPAPLDVAGERVLSAAEEAIRRGAMGLAPVAEVLAGLWASNAIILSGTVTSGSMAELQPLYIPKGEVRMLAMFTDGSRIPSEASETAPYALSIPVSALFPTLGPLIGVVVNPGSRLGLEITPEGIADAIAAHLPPPTPNRSADFRPLEARKGGGSPHFGEGGGRKSALRGGVSGESAGSGRGVRRGGGSLARAGARPAARRG